MLPLALGTLATRAWHAYVCNWRIPAVERSPKTTPVVSGIGGIATIRDPAIFGNRHTQVCVA